jgi:hypothetical protein
MGHRRKGCIRLKVALCRGLPCCILPATRLPLLTYRRVFLRRRFQHTLYDFVAFCVILLLCHSRHIKPIAVSYTPGTTIDKSTPEGQAKLKARNEYFQALGDFISTFSTVESSLFAFLGTLSLAAAPMARALFGDIRVKNVISAVARVFRARRMMMAPFEDSEPERIAKDRQYDEYMAGHANRVFQQLADITTIRNDIVHSGTLDATVENPIISNWARALDDDALTEYTVSAADLRKMTADLWTIILLLGICSCSPTTARRPPA